MSAKRILLLLVAIFAGGIAAYLAVSGQKSSPAVQQIAAVEEVTTQVLVTNRTIGLGQRIGATDLAWQEWPEAALRPEYITIERLPDALIEMVGVVVRFEMFAGEPVREERIVRADQGYLSAVIGAGMRAVSIRISPESGAGGFIVPNDRVDVILTSSSSNGDQTTTILENVRVLAIGLRLGEGTPVEGEQEQAPGSKTFGEPTTATVELSPSQAENIINAEKLGTLTLALRSIADFADHAKTVQSGGSQSANQVKLIRFGQEQALNIASIAPVVEDAQSAAPIALTPSLPVVAPVASAIGGSEPVPSFQPNMADGSVPPPPPGQQVSSSPKPSPLPSSPPPPLPE